MLETYQGSCHCGRVRFRIRAQRPFRPPAGRGDRDHPISSPLQEREPQCARRAEKHPSTAAPTRWRVAATRGAGQVRSGLPGGGKWIRTLRSAAKGESVPWCATRVLATLEAVVSFCRMTKIAAPMRGDRGFESTSLQRGVGNEPCGCRGVARGWDSEFESALLQLHRLKGGRW
jgi:hypothetical protein